MEGGVSVVNCESFLLDDGGPLGGIGQVEGGEGGQGPEGVHCGGVAGEQVGDGVSEG